MRTLREFASHVPLLKKSLKELILYSGVWLIEKKTWNCEDREEPECQLYSSQRCHQPCLEQEDSRFWKGDIQEKMWGDSIREYDWAS